MVLLILFLAIVLALIFVEVKRSRLSRKYQHVPGIKEFPIIGSIYSIRPNEISDIDILLNTCQVAPVSKVFVFSEMFLFISDPQVLQEILTSRTCCARPFQRKFGYSKYGLFETTYTEWKPIRRAVRYNFASSAIKSFIPIFEKHFQRYCDELNPHINSADIDLYPLSVRTTMRTITESLMGKSTIEDDDIAQTFENFLDNLTTRMVQFHLYPEILFRFSKLHTETMKNLKRLNKHAAQLVEARVMDLKQNIDTPQQLFIDTLMQHSKEYLDETTGHKVVVENIHSIFTAGFDTTSITLSNALLLLAMHPIIDQKVANELAANYHEGDTIDQELLKRLPYLDCVLKETLRLFPALPLTLRTNMDDINLSTIGHVEKGTTFVINFFRLHRWKHIWGEDADEFNPDRFLPENSIGRHPNAYLPLDAGPRVCLGYHYALVSLKVGLITVLSRYRFTTELKMDDLVFKLSMTMKMITKHLVKVEKRNKIK